MKGLYGSFIILAAVLYVSEGLYNRRVLIQHKKSNKYVGLFDGESSSYVHLTNLPEYAQPFHLLIQSDGSLVFQTDDGDVVWDKSYGCSTQLEDLEYYAIEHDQLNQKFSVNTDGTIGSRCCPTCLVVPDANYSRLLVREYTCIYENNEDRIFTFIPISDL